jgi:hypothetical protein
MERKVAPRWQAHARHRSVAADRAYLDALAKRLAHDARLPLGLALKRVQKLAVSAQPKESYRRGGQ